MDGTACHDSAETGPGAARELILKTLGARRVAMWCGVTPDAVYQWLSRGTNDQPIPSRYVPTILAGAKADGLTVDPSVLWPAMRSFT